MLYITIISIFLLGHCSIGVATDTEHDDITSYQSSTKRGDLITLDNPYPTSCRSSDDVTSDLEIAPTNPNTPASYSSYYSGKTSMDSCRSSFEGFSPEEGNRYIPNKMTEKELLTLNQMRDQMLATGKPKSLRKHTAKAYESLKSFIKDSSPNTGTAKTSRSSKDDSTPCTDDEAEIGTEADSFSHQAVARSKSSFARLPMLPIPPMLPIQRDSLELNTESYGSHDLTTSSIDTKSYSFHIRTSLHCSFLRSPTADDLKHYQAIFGNSRAMEKYMDGRPRPPEEIKERHARYVENTNKGNPWNSYLIFMESNDLDSESSRLDSASDSLNFIGHVMVEPSDRGKTNEAELSYVIHPNFWGQRITTNVVGGLIKYLKTNIIDTYPIDGHTITQLYATARPDNPNSIRVLERNGFKLTSTEIKFDCVRHFYELNLEETISTHSSCCTSPGETCKPGNS